MMIKQLLIITLFCVLASRCIAASSGTDQPLAYAGTTTTTSSTTTNTTTVTIQNTQCSPVNCFSTCGSWAYNVTKDQNGCDKCTCITCGSNPICSRTISCPSGYVAALAPADASHPCNYCFCRKVCPVFDCFTECGGQAFNIITVDECRQCSCVVEQPPPSPSPSPSPIPSPSPSPSPVHSSPVPVHSSPTPVDPTPSPSPVPHEPSPFPVYSSPDVVPHEPSPVNSSPEQPADSPVHSTPQPPVSSPPAPEQSEEVNCPNVNCTRECNNSPFRYKYSNKGCRSCDCATGENYCANCTCSTTPIDKEVTIDKYIVKKNFVPYTVYFDPQTVDSVDAAFVSKFEANYGIKRQYNYLIFITKQTTNYRKVLVNLRSVLQYLFTSQQINEETFQSLDQEAQSKLIDLESRVAAQTVTLAELIKDTEEVREIIAQLGFEQSAAPVCLLVGGQLECDLKPSYLNQISSSYMQDNILERVIYTKVPSKITQLTKDIASKTVTVTRSSTTWEIKTITVAQVVEERIWEVTLVSLMQGNAAARTAIEVVSGRTIEGNLNDAAKQIIGTPELFAAVQHELLANFASVTTAALREALSDPEVQQLGQDNRPTAATTVLPARITEEIIKLPMDVLNLDAAILTDLLSQKVEYTL